MEAEDVHNNFFTIACKFVEAPTFSVQRTCNQLLTEVFEQIADLPPNPPPSEGLRSSCRFSIDLECAGLKHHVIISGDVCLSGQANKGLAQGTFRSCLQAQVGSYGHSGTVNEQLPEGSTRLKGWLPVQADRCEQEVERDEGPATQL